MQLDQKHCTRPWNHHCTRTVQCTPSPPPPHCIRAGHVAPSPAESTPAEQLASECSSPPSLEEVTTALTDSTDTESPPRRGWTHTPPRPGTWHSAPVRCLDGDSRRAGGASGASDPAPGVDCVRVGGRGSSGRHVHRFPSWVAAFVGWGYLPYVRRVVRCSESTRSGRTAPLARRGGARFGLSATRSWLRRPIDPLRPLQGRVGVQAQHHR